MSTVKNEPSTAIRGCHHYNKYQNPKPTEKLICYHKTDNPFDIFSIRTRNAEGNAVGRLPCELPRAAKLLLDRGTDIVAVLNVMQL